MSGLTLSLKNEIVEFAPRARVNVVAPGQSDRYRAMLGVDERSADVFRLLGGV